MQTRRTVLALAGASLTLNLLPAGARTQVAGVFRRQIGEATVTALLDGFIALDANMLAGSDPEANAELVASAFLSGTAVDTSINAYLVELGDRTIMIDGGAAGAFGPTTGHLPGAVAAAGIDPAAVDTLFTTHAHPDHVGIFATEGAATFANAQLVMHAREHAFWTDDANFTGADEQTKSFVAAARGAFAPYEARTTLIEHGAEIAPGLTAMHLPGHTPGHTGLMLESAGESLLLWADIVHIGPVQFARPELTIPFDVDQSMAAETRAKLLDQVVADRLEIAGSHLDFPSFGHVVRAGDGYRFVKGRWDHAL
ncbi:MAG: MBL fold metallo-hydrolase [Pikeienuella sp.]